MKMRKENANKGFSLVELIIVIAIMVILVAVLAPQYMRFVEKSRFSTDITMVNEVKTAIDTALADEEIYKDVTGLTAAEVITFSDTAITTTGIASLDLEVKKTVDLTKTNLTSKTCKDAGVTITINTDGTTAVDAPEKAN